MPQMHLRQSRFTCSTCWPFTKNKEHKNLKESGHSRHIYQNKLDKGHFQHDVAYGDFKDLPKRTASDKLLNGLALMVYIFLIKRLKIMTHVICADLLQVVLLNYVEPTIS